MYKIIKEVKDTVTLDSKEFHSVVKKITAVSEADDSISIRQNKKYLMIESSTSKADVVEAIEADGVLATSFQLSPKNLLDIASCLVGSVSIGDKDNSVIFKSKKGDISINAAIVKMEA
jgi:hypothetical protein